MSADESSIVKTAMLAASEAISAVLNKAEQEGIVDEEGNEVPSRVVAIVAASTLATMYAAASGLPKERFIIGMELTFDHALESLSEVEEIIKRMGAFDQTQGENKWVQ